MNYCGNCGIKLSTQNKFCGSCGVKLKELENIAAELKRTKSEERPEKLSVDSEKEVQERELIKKHAKTPVLEKESIQSIETQSTVKKAAINVGSIIAYFLLVNIQLGLFVYVNFSFTGSPGGPITALGIVSFWTSYKLVKTLRSKL